MSYYSELLTKVLQIPGVGSKTAQKIVTNISNDKLRDDEDLVEAIQSLKDSLRLPKSISEINIRDAIFKGEQALEQNERSAIKMTCVFDQDYPIRLKGFKANPPVLLHYKGDIASLNQNPTCAVIGTREPTANGYSVGVRVGELLAENKVVVVSGLAKGCDTAGHTGCLNKSGKTVAVLAHGLKHLYPKENRRLSEAILENGGALVSEYFYEQTARGNFFVERDRIQAGLSDNIFVVETGVKGGTMHTVKYALENHRRIFTYKHPEKYQGEEKAQGNQLLIKEKKAAPVGNAEDFNHLLNYIYTFSFVTNLSSIQAQFSSNWLNNFKMPVHLRVGNLPFVNLPSVTPSSINFPSVNLPPINFPFVNLPSINLPPFSNPPFARAPFPILPSFYSDSFDDHIARPNIDSSRDATSEEVSKTKKRRTIGQILNDVEKHNDAKKDEQNSASQMNLWE